MKDYDIIIAGGGLSGTLLLSLLLKSSLRNKKFLLIEKSRKARESRHWSFWFNEKTFIDHLLKKQWQKFSVTFPDFSKDFPIQNNTISLLESKEYYSFVESNFRRYKNVDIVDNEVIDIIQEASCAHVYTKNAHYASNYVFDSTYSHCKEKNKLETIMMGISALVSTRKAKLDPTLMQFIDFRGCPNDELFFFYVLPITTTQAIIETAQVTKSSHVLDRVHKKLLQNYIENVLCVREYEITKEHYGSIPLGKKSTPHFFGNRIVNIGAKAGLVHPVTSYGFVNIYKDCKLIVESLERTGAPNKRYNLDWKETLINKSMLHLMEYNPQGAKQMYKELFLSCKNGDEVLAYLNGELSFLKSLMLLKKVNPTPLIKARYSI